MPDDPLPQSLSAREAGKPIDDTLYEGVPPHLERPLQEWVYEFLTPQLARRIGPLLRRPLGTHPLLSGTEELAETVGRVLLDVVDLALQLDMKLRGEVEVVGMAPFSEYDPEPTWPSASTRARLVEELDQLLTDAGSAYEVDWAPPLGLTRRVDPTVAGAVRHAAETAAPTAAKMLRSSWRHVYGLHPDPTASYRDAVRAVEEVAGPLVLPNNTKPSLGTVRNHLRDAGGKWRFVLVDDDGAETLDPLVEMMSRLWSGQVSRHGGGQHNRDQTQAEAEAAVHLAAVLVQLLFTGALTRRESA